eukprot:469184_1
MQITEVDPDMTDFNLHIITSQITAKKNKIFIKDIVEKNVTENTIEGVIIVKKGKCSAEIDIEIDEKHNGLHILGAYQHKNAEKTIPNSNTASIIIERDNNEIPPENEQYRPKCINLETLRLVKDEKNKTVNVYWDTPLEIYGTISYKIVNHINETERETISILPYSIPLYYAFLPFKVCTIA